MNWKKLGLVYGPDHSLGDWAVSHAMIPTPFLLSKDVIRVYVTFCDFLGRGRPGYVDVSAHDPQKILKVSPAPLLDIGRPGTFDDNGVVPCSVVRLENGKVYMYYVGFELCKNIRYRLLTGLAISDDGGESFVKYSQAPILERSDPESYFRCGPFCLIENGIFKLWYIAGNSWIDVGGKSLPVYDLRYAESSDGISWPKEGKVLFATSGDEHGFGRPFVVRKSNELMQLYYSIRSINLQAYRIGYAESANGKDWIRLDSKINLDVTKGSFDSHAIMYPGVIRINGRAYLFYNGNNFGRDGFAVAISEDGT